jgi:hypothetical protein
VHIYDADQVNTSDSGGALDLQAGWQAPVRPGRLELYVRALVPLYSRPLAPGAPGPSPPPALFAGVRFGF